MERRPEQVENKLIFRENNKIFRMLRDAMFCKYGLTGGSGRA